MIEEGERTEQLLTNSGGEDGSQRRVRGLALPPEPSANRSGQVVGGTYRLLERIGVGGMAEVYAAEHLRVGRRFALKVLRVERAAKSARRFRRETEAIARIESEYVVSLLDCGEFPDGTPYLVMELLHGVDLRRLIENASPLSIPRAVRLVWEACQGVTAVHRAGLIHRDLKPENLFVTRRATGEDWCKVLDFGVAKLEVSGSTAEGALVGTVRYMAPEQLIDGASAGPGVDVYALGAVLYECLCGEPPHSGTSMQELMFKIMNEQPRSLERLRAEVPLELARAVARALQKSPERRFKDVPAFARSIAPFMPEKAPSLTPSGLETVVSEPFGDDSPRAMRRKTVVPFVFGCLFGAGVLALGARATNRPTATGPLTISRPPSASVPAPTALSAAAPPTPGLPQSRPAEVRAVVRAEAIFPAGRSTPSAQATARKTEPLPVPATPFPSRRFDPQNPYSQ